MITGFERLLLATFDTDGIRAFYTEVLGAELTPIEIPGATLYQGTLGPFAFMLCPASVAGIEAKDHRHQLRFAVADVAEVVARAEAFGVTPESDEPLQDGRRSVIVRDPDGNAVELVAGR